MAKRLIVVGAKALGMGVVQAADPRPLDDVIGQGLGAVNGQHHGHRRCQALQILQQTPDPGRLAMGYHRDGNLRIILNRHVLKGSAAKRRLQYTPAPPAKRRAPTGAGAP